jgi:hypothetical protein
VTSYSEALTHLLTQKSALIERKLPDAKKHAKKFVCAPLEWSGSVPNGVPIPADASVVDAVYAMGAGGGTVGPEIKRHGGRSGTIGRTYRLRGPETTVAIE